MGLITRNKLLIRDVHAGDTKMSDVVWFHTGQVLSREDASTDRRIRFVMSTPGRKGDGIELATEGWQLERFQKNPVALDSHRAWVDPIGRWHDVGIDDQDRLSGELEFAPPELSPRAGILYGLYAAKFMNSVSIGFKMLKWAFNEDAGPYAIDSEEQELYEGSTVTLPMDPDAVAFHLQESKGEVDETPLVEEAIRILDECKDDPVIVQWAHDLYKATSAPVLPAQDVNDSEETATVIRFI